MGKRADAKLGEKKGTNGVLPNKKNLKTNKLSGQRTESDRGESKRRGLVGMILT